MEDQSKLRHFTIISTKVLDQWTVCTVMHVSGRGAPRMETIVVEWGPITRTGGKELFRGEGSLVKHFDPCKRLLARRPLEDSADE